MRTTRIRAAIAALATAVAVGAGSLVASPAMASGPCGPDDPSSLCPVPYLPPQTTRTDLLAQGAQTFSWGNDHQTVYGGLYEVVRLSDGAKLWAYVMVTTTTWTDNWLTGFHASSWVDLGPSAYSTAQQRYGVDGTISGFSTRTDSYTESVSVAFAENDRGGWITPHAVHS